MIGEKLTAFFDGVEDMTEKHNCRKGGKRLWVLEECRSTKEEFHANMDSLKRLITNATVTENPKCMAIREVSNLGMMIVLSNHMDCISVTTTDRRYSFLKTSPTRRGPEHHQWWADLRARLMCEDTGNHVYTWLMTTPEQLPDPTCVLSNGMRHAVQEISKPPYRLFIECRLREIEVENWWISKEQLYDEYKEWCHDNGHMKTVLSAARFHGKMEELADNPPEDLGDNKTLSIRPFRRQNRRGYSSAAAGKNDPLEPLPKRRLAAPMLLD